MALRRLAQNLTRPFRSLRPWNEFDSRRDQRQADNLRIEGYKTYRRWYEGVAYRGALATGVETHAKRLQYNFLRPIVNIAAGWLAGNPLVWDVRGADGSTDEAATEAAKAIWDRSGAERTFLEAAIATNIYGDGCILVGRPPEGGDPVFEFVCPDLCFPILGGKDFEDLLYLEIAYQVTNLPDEPYTRHEYYDARRGEFFNGEVADGGITYDNLPAVWVRNNRVPGEMFGQSDIVGLTDLVEEYDHLARKFVRIVDYYAGPRPVFTGCARSELVLDVETAIFLPRPDSKAEFMEMKGSAPDVEAALTRVRNAIAEVSQVPAVAFGQMDKGYSQISGIGLKILYGPLLDKVRRKQANWGPALERAMWLALADQGLAVELPSVNLIWPDPTPTDPLLEVQREAAAVAAGLKSKASAMRSIGIEDPEAELEAMKAEQELLVPPEVKAAMELNAQAAKEKPGGPKP